jgi:hypothetical protein
MRRFVILVLLLVAFASVADFRESPEGVVRGLLYARMQYFETWEESSIDIAFTCFNWKHAAEKDTVYWEVGDDTLYASDWDNLPEFFQKEYKSIWLYQRDFYKQTADFWPLKRDFETTVNLTDDSGFTAEVFVSWPDGMMTFDVRMVDDVFLIWDVSWG